MSSKRRKHLTRRQRYERRRAKRYAAWKERHPNPTPYNEWPDYAEWMRNKINKSLVNDPILPTWSSSRLGKPKTLSADDLAVGLWAIQCTEGKGTSYGQMRCCFRVCLDQNCHDAKAKAIFTELQRRRLIARTGNYCPGKRGNVYVVVHDPDKFFQTYRSPIPFRRQFDCNRQSVDDCHQSSFQSIPDSNDDPY